MKIVNRQQFLDFPSGTLYRDYQPCVFGELKVKGDTTRAHLRDGTCTDEFNVLHLDLVDAVGSVESLDILDDAVEKGASFRFDYDAWMRDGWSPEYNAKLYAVYEPEDVRQLIEALQELSKGPTFGESINRNRMYCQDVTTSSKTVHKIDRNRRAPACGVLAGSHDSWKTVWKSFDKLSPTDSLCGTCKRMKRV